MTTEVAAGIGISDPAKVAEDLKQFEEDLRRFSSERDTLIKEHEGKWVGIYRGQVIIKDTPEELAVAMQEQAIPRAHAVMEYLSNDTIAAY